MIEIINVSSKGQIVIPEKIRKHLGIKAGSKLVLFEKDESIFLKKAEQVIKHLEESERKEEVGWMILAEKSLEEVWDNPRDEGVWKKYLSK